jgi:hypothetical protein
VGERGLLDFLRDHDHRIEKYVFKGATGQAKLARARAARESQLICMSGIIRNTGLLFYEVIPCNNFIISIRRGTGKLCLARGTHPVTVIKRLGNSTRIASLPPYPI